MYNASLSIFYVLVIVHGWKDDKIEKIEPLLHINAIAWGLGTGVASLSLTLFNQVGWDCWISAAPLGCQESWNSPDGTTTCVRGDNGSLYQWAFYYAPLWIAIILVICHMYWVYHTVRKQEMRMIERYNPTASATTTTLINSSVGSSTTTGQIGASLTIGQAKVSHHKLIAAQAAYYVVAFLVSWLFPTIFQLVIVTTQTFPFALLFLTALCVPIQGTLNLVVFTRPAFIKYRKANTCKFFLGDWFRMLRQEFGRNSASAL